MLIKRQRSFDLPERLATPENLFVNRRTILKAAGLPRLTPASAISLLRSTGSPQQDAPSRPKTQRI